MFCIYCGQTNTQVTNSRQKKKSPTVWRRRCCKGCSETFTTYENVALDQLKVVSSGKKLTPTPFSHAKLLISLAGCFDHKQKKRPEIAEALSKTIETKILRAGQQTTKRAICEISYDVLRHYDHLAGVQYAAKHADVLGKNLA